MPMLDSDDLSRYPMTDEDRVVTDRVRTLVWSAQQACPHPETLVHYQAVLGYLNPSGQRVFLAECGLCGLRGWYTREEPTIKWVKGWEGTLKPRIHLSGTPMTFEETNSLSIPEPVLV